MAALTGNVAGSINLTGSGGTDDYRELTHKPSINNITLNGDLSLSDLGIPSEAVTDVKVDGYSVVTSGVAHINLPEVPVQDVKVDGASVVNAQGIADITIPSGTITDVEVNGASVVSHGIAAITAVTDVTVDGTSVVTNGVAELTASGAAALTDLTDVDIDTPTDGDVLTYDGITDKWINAPIADIYSESVIWDDVLTPSTSGSDITLDESFTNFDRLLFVVKPNSSSEISFCEFPVSQLEVGSSYAINSLSAYSTTAYFSITSATELHIMSWASANLTQYQKIIGIKY